MIPLPNPLRALVAWPAAPASALARSLKDVGVDATPADDLAGYLSVPGYYHVAYAELAEWRGFSPRKRATLAGRVCLVILGPGPATADDCAGSAACLYLPAALSDAERSALFMAFHKALAQGWSCEEVAAGSGGRLAFAGAEPVWPAPAAKRISAVSADGGAVSIGRDSRATYVSGQYVERAGPGFGPIFVKGDAVYGDKIVQHADGDQINITRGAADAAKIEQHAGGDQVNVNRGGGAKEPDKPPTCRECDAPLPPPGRFCQECGAEQ